MKMRKQTFLKCFIVLLVCFCVLCVDNVYAQDTEDLLNIYGLTLGGPSKAAVTSEMDLIQRQIHEAEVNQILVDGYNAELEQKNKTTQEKISEINIEIDSYQKVNSSISDWFGNNILTADITEVISNDKAYKNNISSMNILLKNRDEYQIDYSYRDYSYNMIELEVELQTKKAVYLESLDTFNLGEVDNIRFPMPVERHVNSSYGTRIDPISKTETRFHAGTDYRAQTGTEVYSLFNGVISSCGYQNAIGNFIIVQSGENVKTLYCHLSEIKVTKGQEVNQYDLIGLTGATGTRVTGPHLHLALYLNGSTYDVDKLWQ